MSDLSTVPQILAALNDLRIWGGIVLLLLCLLSLTAFGMWLWFRYKDSQLGGKVKTSDAKAIVEAARLEQEGKDRRAAIYAGAISDLRKSIDRMQDSVRQNDQHNTAQSEAFSAALQQQMKALQALLSSVRGVLTANDSLKLIETYFSDVLAAEFSRVGTASIIRNNYQADKEFIKVRFIAALSEVTSKVRTALSEYPMVLGSDVFFPMQDGEYTLVLASWDVVRKAHEERYAAGTVHDLHVTERTSEQVAALVRKAVMAHFTACRARALDVYRAG